MQSQLAGPGATGRGQVGPGIHLSAEAAPVAGTQATIRPRPVIRDDEPSRAEGFEKPMTAKPVRRSNDGPFLPIDPDVEGEGGDRPQAGVEDVNEVALVPYSADSKEAPRPPAGFEG